MKQPIKNIVILGPSIDSRGGISSIIENYLNEKEYINKWPILHIPTFREGNKLKKLYVAIISYIQFLFLLINKKVEIAHVHVSSRASFWRKSVFSLTAFFFNRPVIMHFHSPDFMEFYEKECGKIKQLFIRYVLKKCSKIIALSTQWKHLLEQIIPLSSITIIYNYVSLPDDLPHFKTRKKNTLLFLGRLSQRKGIYDLVSSISMLRKFFPNIKLLCGGDGEIDKVKKRAEELGVSDSIEFLGWVTGKEKERLLLEASLFVLPSYHEGLPMSILEAMAFGLPVVSTNVGGIPDAVTNEIEGFTVDAGDIQQLKNAIEKLLANPDIIDQMGKNARSKIESRFVKEQILPKLDAVYEELGASMSCSAEN